MGRHRVWDAAGQSEKIDVPTQVAFAAGARFKPKATSVQWAALQWRDEPHITTAPIFPARMF